jgi:hypothetical protein
MGSTYKLDELNKKRLQNIRVEFLQLHLKMKSLTRLVAETKVGMYEYVRQASISNIQRQVIHSSSSVPV